MDESNSIPIGLIARAAAMVKHPPDPSENSLRAKVRSALRESTAKDYLTRLVGYVRKGLLPAVNPLNDAPFDPALDGLLDPDDAMWALGQSDAAKALDLLGLELSTLPDEQVHDEEGAMLLIRQLHRRASTAEAALCEQWAAEEAAKAAALRYTLNEAATAIALGAGERKEVIRGKLKRAAHAGTLPVYAPGSNARYEYGTDEGQAPRLRDFHEEARAHDLNAWLGVNESHISWRFPIPTSTATDNCLTSKTGAIAPVQRRQSQEALIVAKLQELGFDPQALPKTPRGRVSPAKRAARATLEYSEAVFDKAWQRLLKEGKIRNS